MLHLVLDYALLGVKLVVLQPRIAHKAKIHTVPRIFQDLLTKIYDTLKTDNDCNYDASN